jgi:hypothetical protein
MRNDLEPGRLWQLDPALPVDDSVQLEISFQDRLFPNSASGSNTSLSEGNKRFLSMRQYWPGGGQFEQGVLLESPKINSQLQGNLRSEFPHFGAEAKHNSPRGNDPASTLNHFGCVWFRSSLEFISQTSGLGQNVDNVVPSIVPKNLSLPPFQASPGAFWAVKTQHELTPNKSYLSPMF